MSHPLSNTVALVTGASSGNGAAIATKLAALGAAVVLVARRKDRLEDVAEAIRNADGKALVVEADVSDAAAAAAALTDAVAMFGKLDIVVNNAGLMLIGPSVGADLGDWQRMIEANIQGMLNITHAALPHLLAAAQGARQVADIINLSSVAAFQFTPQNGVYAMTKAAINAYSESLRQEVTQSHVRVGVIEPGAVATELVSHNKGEVKVALAKFFEDHEALQPEDIADAIAFMVTRPRRASIPQLWIGPTEQV